eukprot:GHVT01051271.1.p1 GENE.GHVT01051271.1~~GHVT01051271.1.p1  ORF type:complete len:135 (+),score=6.68 GHVT01051271.1:105-509(+)
MESRFFDPFFKPFEGVTPTIIGFKVRRLVAQLCVKAAFLAKQTLCALVSAHLSTWSAPHVVASMAPSRVAFTSLRVKPAGLGTIRSGSAFVSDILGIPILRWWNTYLKLVVSLTVSGRRSSPSKLFEPLIAPIH